jgi:hypothetical protein
MLGMTFGLKRLEAEEIGKEQLHDLYCSKILSG